MKLFVDTSEFFIDWRCKILNFSMATLMIECSLEL